MPLTSIHTHCQHGITAVALACVKLRDVSVLSGAKATAAETTANIAAGCWVKATETFSDYSSQEVPEGSLGKVVKIDDDGVADIDFEGMDGTQSVENHDFGKISVLSADHVCVSTSGKTSLLTEAELFHKRAQREAVVKMLVSPTQAAGALDVLNKEGRSVLMYAAMHGLGSVVEQLVAAAAKPELTDQVRARDGHSVVGASAALCC